MFGLQMRLWAISIMTFRVSKSMPCFLNNSCLSRSRQSSVCHKSWACEGGGDEEEDVFELGGCEFVIDDEVGGGG